MINEIDIESHKGLNNITIRNDKIIYKSEAGIITIPSKQFPLENKKTIKVFSMANTETLDKLDKNISDRIIDIFNAYNFKIGRCYDNCEHLIEMFDSDIKLKIKTYVGWLLLESKIPIHHCWIMYDDKIILDGIENYSIDFMEEVTKDCKTPDEYRRVLLNVMFEHEKLLNSQRFVIGRCSDLYFYVGTECTPAEGKNIYKRLISKYPNHIAYNYAGMNPNGASKFQQMYYEHKNV